MLRAEMKDDFTKKKLEMTLKVNDKGLNISLFLGKR